MSLKRSMTVEEFDSAAEMRMCVKYAKPNPVLTCMNVDSEFWQLRLFELETEVFMFDENRMKELIADGCIVSLLSSSPVGFRHKETVVKYLTEPSGMDYFAEELHQLVTEMDEMLGADHAVVRYSKDPTFNGGMILNVDVEEFFREFTTECFKAPASVLAKTKTAFDVLRQLFVAEHFHYVDAVVLPMLRKDLPTVIQICHHVYSPFEVSEVETYHRKMERAEKTELIVLVHSVEREMINDGMRDERCYSPRWQEIPLRMLRNLVKRKYYTPNRLPEITVLTMKAETEKKKEEINKKIAKAEARKDMRHVAILNDILAEIEEEETAEKKTAVYKDHQREHAREYVRERFEYLANEVVGPEEYTREYFMMFRSLVLDEHYDVLHSFVSSMDEDLLPRFQYRAWAFAAADEANYRAAKAAGEIPVQMDE